MSGVPIGDLGTIGAVSEAGAAAKATGAVDLATASVVKQGIHEYAEGGGTYVGQSGNIPRRIGEHLQAGRLQSAAEVTSTEVLGGKTAREVAEHGRIQEITGGTPARPSGKGYEQGRPDRAYTKPSAKEIAILCQESIMLELKVPNNVLSNSASQEVLRAWIVGDVNVLVTRPSAWEDPAAWGLFLVDIARQVAHGLSREGKGTFEAVLSRIMEGFDAEWEANTNELDPAQQ